MAIARKSPFSNVEKVQRLDAEIAALNVKLMALVDRRKALLDVMIEEGNRIAAEAQATMSVARAANYVSSGRSFSDEQIKSIRAAWSDGESQCALARRYGVSQPTIFKIVKRQAYQHVA